MAQNTNTNINAPLITIVTAVFNGGKVLETAFASVFNQEYKNVEYIVIDGGSKDNTIEIIKKYQDKIAYWISEPDKGVYDAWNKAVAKASGEWICFLGADDVFTGNQVLLNVLPLLGRALKEDVRFVYGKVKLLSSDGSKELTVWGEEWEEAKKDIFKYMTVTHCGAFHHRDLFTRHGLFDISFRITGDYEFTLREFASGGQAIFINEIITCMRAGGISADLRLKLRVARENIRALNVNGKPATMHHRVQIFKAKLSNILISTIGIRAVKQGSDLYRRFTGKDPIWTKID